MSGAQVKTNRVIDALIAARNTPEEVFQVIDVNRNGRSQLLSPYQTPHACSAGWISKLEWKSKLPELGISPQAYNQRELDAVDT